MIGSGGAGGVGRPGVGVIGGAGRLGVGGAGAGAGEADRLTLTGLRVRGRHGVSGAERELGQEFVVDATLWLDTTPAAAGDDVTATVHYGDLAEQLARIVAGEPVDLIETLAHRLLDACLAHARVESAEVTVHKPAAPIPVPFADVAVTVARRQPHPAGHPAGTGHPRGSEPAAGTGHPRGSEPTAGTDHVDGALS